MTALPALYGRVVLVTGATGGLGGALCRLLAEAGASVVASGRNLRRLERLYGDVERAGHVLQLYPMDLAGAQPGDFDECIERIVAEHGRLDALIHCAVDFPGLTPLEHVAPERFAVGMHVNLTARLWLTQAALPILGRYAGAVMFVHDDPECVAAPLWGAYGIAQSAHPALMAMFKDELASRDVAVVGFVPGPMPTAHRARAYGHEVGPVVLPEVAALQCLKCLDDVFSDRASAQSDRPSFV